VRVKSRKINMLNVNRETNYCLLFRWTGIIRKLQIIIHEKKEVYKGGEAGINLITSRLICNQYGYRK